MFVQGQAEIIEVIADSGMMMVNGNLTELDLPSGLLIAAIYRGGAVIIPDGKTIIQKGDRVLIFSLLSDISDLDKLLKMK